MNCILINPKIKNCTKDILNKVIKKVENNKINIIKKISILLLIIVAIIIGNYKPIYEVYVNNESLGYVESINEFNKRIKNEVLTSEDSNAVDVDFENEISYKLKFGLFTSTNENEILENLYENKKTTYLVYAINVNNEAKAYVNTWDEAEKIVKDMEEEYQDTVDADVTVTEKYTNNIESINVEDLEVAETNVTNNLRSIKDEQEQIALATFNGVYFSVKPVLGTITSRFGAVESIRNHAHSGMDIAAPNGTEIKAAAPGKVIQSEYYGGYGNLIVIDHGNGVTSYYGHCSKLYASVGDEVNAGDVIGTVGSTGHSTGNHLHFEIRLNGVQVNPQNYIYR